MLYNLSYEYLKLYILLVEFTKFYHVKLLFFVSKNSGRQLGLYKLHLGDQNFEFYEFKAQKI